MPASGSGTGQKGDPYIVTGRRALRHRGKAPARAGSGLENRPVQGGRHPFHGLRRCPPMEMSTGATVEESERGLLLLPRLPRGSKVMSTDEQDIRRKLKQIEEVVPVLEAMDVPDLPYKQWLEGQDRKNQPLTGANQTELKLKKSQIERLESRGHAK